MINSKIKVAIITSNLLGDAVVTLPLANNLAINGFDITFYSKMLYSMSGWTNSFKFKEYSKEKTEKEIDEENFDVILADPRSILGKRKEEQCDRNLVKLYADKKYLFIGFLSNSLENLIKGKDIDSKITETLKKFVEYSKIKVEIKVENDNKPIAQHIASNCSRAFNLEKTDTSSGLVPPKNLIKNKNNKRVLIHPFSSTKRDSWPLPKFLKVARLLKNDGWDILFISSPQENSSLKKNLDGEFDAPVFPAISSLSEYIYESRALIGNDSGNVHLASAIGIESFVTSNKMDGYTWRPGYGLSTIMTPSFILRFKKNKYWKIFLSVQKVYKIVSTKLN